MTESQDFSGTGRNWSSSLQTSPALFCSARGALGMPHCCTAFRGHSAFPSATETWGVQDLHLWERQQGLNPNPLLALDLFGSWGKILANTTATSGLSCWIVKCCERPSSSIHLRQPFPKTKRMKRRTSQELATSINLCLSRGCFAMDCRGCKSRTGSHTYTTGALPPTTGQESWFQHKDLLTVWPIT